MWTWESRDGRALRYWREVAFAAFSNCNPLVRKTCTSFEPFVTFMQDHVNSKYIEISTKSCSTSTLMVKKHDLTTCAIYAVNPTIRSPHASSRVGILYPCKATSDLLESRLKSPEILVYFIRKLWNIYCPILVLIKGEDIILSCSISRWHRYVFSPGVAQRLMIEAQTEQQTQKHKPCIYDKLVNFFQKLCFNFQNIQYL